MHYHFRLSVSCATWILILSVQVRLKREYRIESRFERGKSPVSLAFFNHPLTSSEGLFWSHVITPIYRQLHHTEGKRTS